MFDGCSCEAKLSEVCSSINRGKPAVYAGSSDYHIIGQACIRTDHIEFERTRFMEPSRFDREYVLRSGDVLVNSTGVGSLGRCCEFYNPDNGIYFTDSHVTILRLDTNIMNPIFLKHYLNQSEVQNELYNKCVNGSTNQIELNKAAFTRFPIPEPPIGLQNQFADFVKQVNKSRIKFKQIFQSSDDLVKSRFIEMFGRREDYSRMWTMKSFNDCCQVMYGYPFDSTFFNEDGNGTRLIRIRDINTGPSETYTTECVDKQYLVKNGDLLVSMDGDFRAILWNSGSALLNQRTCKMSGRTGMINDFFLLHYLRSELDIIHSKTSATTVKHLSAKEINKFSVPMPPLTMQNQFADFVKQVDKSKFTSQDMRGMLLAIG